MTASRIDIDAVTAIVRDVAAEYILPRFRNLQAGDIAYKIGDDPVTVADKEAESALSARLSDLLKGSKVVGEENFSANPGVLESFLGESPVWIIDPIDGTRNFVKGSPEFGVIIALSEQNQTVAGWIYDPSSGEVITAEKGGGAFYKGKKLKVLPPAPFPNMTGLLGEFLIDASVTSGLSRDMWPVFQPTAVGAHEYPLLVVEGHHFDKNKPQIHFRASLHHCTPWDDAAGVLIHQEAGGYSAYWNGMLYKPSEMGRGLALAPDKHSWRELKDWCSSFTEMP